MTHKLSLPCQVLSEFTVGADHAVIAMVHQVNLVPKEGVT